MYTKSDYGTRSRVWEEVIVGVCMHYDKAYGYPAQKTILFLGEKWHGLVASLRTLNRDLKRMEKEGRFRRVRRLTRKGILRGRFTSTMYILGRKLFKRAYQLKKWADKVLSAYRLPKLANNKSQRENEIFKEASGDVGMLLNPVIKGGASPIKGIL